MTQVNRSFKISILLAATLLLANCGKKEFSAATSASETAKGGEVTPVGPGNPDIPVIPPGTDVPVTPPGGETPAGNDVLVAVYPVSYLFLKGGSAVSLADLATTTIPFLKLAQNAVLAQHGSFLGCEPTYAVYRVKFSRFLTLTEVDPQTWIAGIKQNSTLVGRHQADYYCNLLESGEDF